MAIAAEKSAAVRAAGGGRAGTRSLTPPRSRVETIKGTGVTVSRPEESAGGQEETKAGDMGGTSSGPSVAVVPPANNGDTDSDDDSISSRSSDDFDLDLAEILATIEAEERM